MLSRTSQLASAILLSACFAGASYAQTPAAPAKTPTPQQQRIVSIKPVGGRVEFDMVRVESTQ